MNLNHPATAILIAGFFAITAGAAALSTTSSETTTSTEDASAGSTAPILFGMDANSIDEQIAAGVDPDVGTFWVGPWTLKHGWGGPDSQMRSMRDQGVMPAIHHYYWGDDISQDCITNGCWSDLHGAWKDQDGWQKLTDELVLHLNQQMQGEPVMIFLETEFNKADLQYYEPLDPMLAEKAQQIKQGYPQATVVLALGSWNTPAWATWDRAAAASDAIGLQGMRGSTRDSEAHYDALYEDTLRNIHTANDMFGQPVVLMDLALSTYPEPKYISKQANELGQFFDNLGELKAAGVEAMVYRSWRDTNMDLNNYYGHAERHWGLAYQDNTHKPSATVWIEGVQAERGQPAGGGSPAPTEPFTATFQPSPNSNAWWVEVSVSASAAPSQVHARHDDGSWTSLSKTSWGTWAKSFHAPAGGTMTFRATDAHGQTAEASFAWLSTTNRAPVAAIDHTVDGLRVALSGERSSDPDGDELTYHWTFGDGSDAAGAIVDHVYADGGTYQVALRVDDGTSSAQASQAVTVVAPNRAPTAAFDVVVDGLTVHVTSKATDPDGDALTHRWTFGDGATAQGAQAAHRYGAGGGYAITLTASDGQAEAAATKQVTVRLPAFEPVITPATGNNPWWVEFRVSGTVPAETVKVRHDDGAWASLSKTSWGTWAKSFHAPVGGTMHVLAADAHGQQAAASVPWLAERVWEPTLTPTANSNDWWVEVKVDAPRAPSAVLARHDDGSWTSLSKTSWGTWAKSFHAPPGSMTFRAIDSYGQSHEETFSWLQPDVTFHAKTPDNPWWVEVVVDSDSTVHRVDALVDGQWHRLDPTKWGTWARSVHAEGDVVFRAMTSDGVTTSASIRWG